MKKIWMVLVLLNIVLLGDSREVTETVEVSLDSFTILGIVLLIGLSSLLGVFFLKDELA